MTRILVSVGEVSADAYASQVLRALRSASPSVEVESVGGPQMAAEGATMIASLEDLSVVGLSGSVRTIPRHLRLRAKLGRDLAGGRYDLALLLDYPGFHLSLAGAAARAGVPVLYYIAPQLWAWGGWRASAIRRRVRAMAVVLPFEQRYFNERGIAATFVGHPLLDTEPADSRDMARDRLGLAREDPVLALFPGSRPLEIGRMWPRFRDAARLLAQRIPRLQVILAGTSHHPYHGAEDVTVWHGPSRHVFAAADAGLCKSGTSTLEAALHGMPIVIAYRMDPLSFAVARRVVRVSHVGLVNLILGRDVAPELLQGAVTAEALADAAHPLLDPSGPPARAQRGAFAEVRSRLGTPGAARRVAEMALALVA